jgi:photosystem I reaction center subunit XII
MTDAQVYMALFIALFPGILAYKLCTELYKA